MLTEQAKARVENLRELVTAAQHCADTDPEHTLGYLQHLSVCGTESGICRQMLIKVVFSL